MNRALLMLMLVLSITSVSFSQCFTKNWSGNGVDQMNVYIMNATLNGENLQAGDQIGVFDGSNCVGTGTVTGSMISIACSKDDPVTPEVDGYISGHSISFQICDASSGFTVTDISVTVNGGSAVFEASGSFFATLAGTLDCVNPPSPVVGAITQTTCSSATGSVQLSGLPSSGNWTINPGTITGSGTTTTISGLAAGSYAWTVTNSLGCTSDPSQNVTINPQPQAPSQPGFISGNATVCQGTQQTYSVSAVSGASSYTWSLPSGWTGTSTTNSITVTVGSDGGNISVTASNACGTSTARTLDINVTTVPSQPSGITGDVAVCQGAAESYSIDAVAGASSYTWSLPSGWTGNSSTASITATPSATSGNISVTANNTCGSGSPRTLAVTVGTLPAQPASISGNTSVCQGIALTYTASEVSGATSYSWILPSGWTGSSSSSSIDVTIGNTSGNISVSAVNVCGTGTPRTLAVTVSATPAQPGAISGNSTVCTGSLQTYSVNTVAGASSYTWTLPSGWTGTSTTNSITATTTAMGGTISVTASNACGTSTASNISVGTTNAPTQPGTITGNAVVCQGASESYSINAVSGATSYTWTLPSGWTGTSTSTSISTSVGATSGNISVAATNACGSGTAKTLAVTVSALPAQPGTITGSATPCQGTSQTYSVSAVTGATSYTWTLPSGWTGTSTTNSITATVGTSGYISVSANNNCGAGTTRTLAVTVSTKPDQPETISGSASVCQSSSQSYSIPGVSGATSYTWTLPAGWTGSSTTNSITVTAGTTGGDISVTASNTCGTSTARTLTVTTTTVPGQSGTISGSTTPCQGTAQAYSVTAVTGATSYTWSLPSGWTGTSTSNSITVTTGATSGNISVTANNSCGAGTARTLAVTVSPLPDQPASITGNASVCAGTSQTYSITAVAGATSYTWTLPAGWTGTSTSNSITATAGSGGTISVAANNTCGSGTARTLAVTVSSAPSQPGVISGNASACQGSATTYSIIAVIGATSYNWTIPAGWTGSSTTNSISATAGATGGDISVSASNSCGTSPVRTLAVTTSTAPSQPGDISGNTSVCQGSSQSYSIGAVTGATSYTWTVPAGWTGTSTTNTITLTAGSTSGNISVTANNSCGSGLAKTMAVTVSGVPAQPGNITGSASVCQGSSQTYSIGAVTGATSYTWSLPAGWTGASTSASITATAGSSGNISVTANNTCGAGTARTLAVSVSAIPDQPGTISGNSTVCQGSSQTYSITAISGATSYSWTLPAGWTGSSTSSSITVTAGSNGGTVSVTANNTCGNSSARSLTVSVGSIPSAPITGMITQPTCELSTGSVALSGLPSSGTWTITANPGGIIKTGSGTSSTFTGLNPGTYNFTVANATGCLSTTSQNVTLNSVPSAPTAPMVDAITQPSCGGTTKGTIELSGLPASGTWTLTRNPGAITSTGTGTTTAIEDLNPGTYSFIVSNASGCSSPSSANAIINAVTATPSAPVVGTITQPSCSVSGGSVVLNNLPSGSWTLTSYPASTPITGSGTSFTVEPLSGGNYTFAVTTGNSCSSENSTQVVINTVPSAPDAPEIGTITQPSCDNMTGGVVLNSLPAQGNWVLTRSPGTIAVSGSGTTETITNLAPGVYTFAVANEAGCNSSASETVNIEEQPSVPLLPVVDSVIQPTCAMATGSIVIKNLPESGTWTLTMNQGAVTITGEQSDTTIRGLIPGDYSFILTGPSGCSTTEPVDTSINDQPEPPSAPLISQVDEVLHSDAAEGNQWYNQDGIISDASAQDYTVNATGDYYVIVTLGGCSSAPSNTVHVIKTGIENSELGVSLTMYPNPVKSELVVEFRNYKLKVSYELINSNGKIVSNGLITERKSIETGSLPSGVYLLKLESGGDYLIRKVIKD